jgi:hypothetical protein
VWKLAASWHGIEIRIERDLRKQNVRIAVRKHRTNQNAMGSAVKETEIVWEDIFSVV